MPSNEDYNNERNANETRASSSLVETVILQTLSSNHLHASISSRRKKERIKVRKELSLLLPAEQRKLIHRNELPHKALTREHILSLLGASSLRSNDLERLISIKSRCVAENKKDVCGFAGMQVRHLMLEVAVDQKMLLNGCVVNSFRQLLHSWKYEQATPQQCETIFHITYGWFDANRTWNYDMESKYLQLRNMMYMDEATDDFEQLDSNLKMGCIARLCAEVKNDLVRQIRKVGVASHGVKVNITRPNHAIEESNRFRKRRKGVEFTIIRTKGDATRAGDVSSEDEGSILALQDPGDSDQEANSDELEQPREQGNDGEQELQESVDRDQEANSDELEQPHEQGNDGEQEIQESVDSDQEAIGDELEPRKQGNDGEQEIQESDDSDELQPHEHGDGVLQELQEPGNSKKKANSDVLNEENAATEEYQDENVITILVEKTNEQQAPAKASSFLCHLTPKLDHFLTIDDLVKETNPYYCQSGFYLSGRHCARCDIEFVSSLSKNGIEREVRPSVKTPGWVCLHAQKNVSMSGADQNKPDGTCIFVLCHDCFQMQVMGSSSLSAKKSTRTRRKPTRRQN